jgi:uncharacterized protein YigA (DUF484 family)
MSDQLEWRERLEGARKQMQEAMTELITNKNYSEVERLLHVADKLMVERSLCSLRSTMPEPRRRFGDSHHVSIALADRLFG